jgi:hypothetical protein
VVHRAYEWTYLYAAVDPTTGESFSVFTFRVLTAAASKRS